ncbi:MAG: hypothetical protein N4J56_000362 [Chroococcidiopsis sp. SAG 2025]|uniref:hypothetical protein n=1 Tax=Chroococcidiopsis sp. SAG 2025 TaxID=171389 RepID=UPI0029372310|nr:hypothetical protein [Chroococcidiopsis sp. SAG 2025]MDV2990708.1 hypothetical protein [Chroococcidiopsis sp. SAG 2025]
MKSQLWVEQRHSLPKFSRDRVVQFIGGSGKAKHYKPAAGTWSYTIEMDMGKPPEMGRIGFETTVLLDEADIQGVE